MDADPFVKLKAAQREGWAVFASKEPITMPAAASLVMFAQIGAGQRVLDVGCGTGVVAVTAARLGATVRGLDLSPVLLDHARANAAIAEVQIEFLEGDVESLPYGDGEFDAVVSQFGHMFAPRPRVAIAEMLRVLRPGGTIAFSTWPPAMFMGRMFDLVNHYLPPPKGVPSVTEWGIPAIIRDRLGEGVHEVAFQSDLITTPALSPMHLRRTFELTSAPIIKLMDILNTDPQRLTQFRGEFDALGAEYFRNNLTLQHFLMTRGSKL